MPQRGGDRNLVKAKYAKAICKMLAGANGKDKLGAQYVAALNELPAFQAIGNSPAQAWRRLYEKLVREKKI